MPVVEILGELWELPDPALRDRWARCVRSGVRGRELAGVHNPYSWTSAATVQSIEARATEWLMFHAAGLSDANGAVAALIGPSGTGKSTAARTLCREHFGYVTDETVAVLSDHSVVPFPKPIAVIPADGGVKVEFGPDELGLRSCVEDLTLGGVILLERRDDVAQPVVEALDLLAGIIAIVPNISALPQLPGGLARLATAVERVGGVHKVVYRNADQLTGVVRSVLAAPSVSSGFRRHGLGRPEFDRHDAVPPRAPVPASPVARAAYHDAIELDGGVLALVGSTCVLLQGVGALVWLAAERPLTFSQACAAVVAVAGEHPDAERLVRTAVEDLMRIGVLEG